MRPAISIWEQETFLSPQDVVIIGGGLVGLWTALELIQSKPSLKITILEKGIIPTGASTRNAGFACFGSPTEMLKDAMKMGEAPMWEIVEMRFKGIARIRQQFKDEVIDYENCGGYECFSQDKHNLDELNDQLHWLNTGMQKITGVKDSFSWSNDRIEEFGFKGFNAMMENKLEGGLHSGKLVQQLIRKVQSLGVQILNGVEVAQVESINDGVDITSTYFRLKTKQVVVCNNALASTLLTEVNVEPTRGQVLVTSPVSHLKMHGTFHYDEGYYYFRNLGDRILMGGARNKAFDEERTNELALNDDLQNELQRFVAEHLLLSTSFTISHQWSGIMAFTENKKPIVKQVEQNIFIAIACNGMGVALSPIVAERVTRLLAK
jgi:gamma-glutamylputrescine oxidase